MSDDIISKKGEVVGQWNGESVEDLKKTLLSIKQDLRKKGDKVEHTGVPHSEQFPDLLNIWILILLWLLLMQLKKMKSYLILNQKYFHL